MYWQIEYKQPYDSVDTPMRMALVVGPSDDRSAAHAFRQLQPNAEQVKAKSMKGSVKSVVIINPSLFGVETLIR